MQPWSDPTSIIPILLPPSGSPPPFLDQPPPGSPQARNPALLQAQIDAHNAQVAVNWYGLGYNVSSGVDWIGWSSQTTLSYVPGAQGAAAALNAARGGAEGFGAGLADPNLTFGQAVERGFIRAGVASFGSALLMKTVPGGVTDFTWKAIQETREPSGKIVLGATGVAANTLMNFVSSKGTDPMDAVAQKYLMRDGSKGGH